MKYLSNKTLAYFDAAPQAQRIDLSALPISAFSKATVEYRKNCGEVSPNDAAYTFYALNHCASVIRKKFTPNEPLPEWAVTVMTDYAAVLAEQSTRLVHYILSITTREMRHLKNGATVSKAVDKAAGCVGMGDFVQHVASNGNETTAVNQYMHNPPNVTVGQYVKGFSHAYHKGSWNGGYGGSAWGEVVDALVAMVHGQQSAEMLVDRGYNLAHNNGPIFNKGMMYLHYDAEFDKILDVQASGQIPTMILDGTNYGPKKTDAAKKAVQLVANALPGEFTTLVNWQHVFDSMPEKKKTAQPSKYSSLIGKTKAAAVKAKPVKPVKPVEVTLFGKKATVVGNFSVFPGVSVPVVQRAKVA